MIIDLHTHSYYSADGQYSIPELLDFFSAGDIVGLTDHETIGGWNEFKAEAQKRGVRPVLGVEWFAYKCHILCYFVNEIPQDFFNFIAGRRKLEKSCMYHLYEILKERNSGLPDYEAVLLLNPHPEEILGLPALAQAVSGAMQISEKEAEDMVRREKKKLPMGTDRPMPFYPGEIIEKINSWGAFSMLAHPYRNFGGRKGRQPKENVEMKIRELAKVSLNGVELFSDGSSKEEVEHLLSLCDELELLSCAGSDKHSPGKSSSIINDRYLNGLAMERIGKWL